MKHTINILVVILLLNFSSITQSLTKIPNGGFEISDTNNITIN